MADAPPPLTRRAVVTGAGAAAVGAGLLATGCSTAPPPAAPADEAAGTPVGPASDVPVGSGRIFDATGVVVTQPDAGTYAAFSTTCPHQGCAVTSVEGTNIVCPCHGSMFALDGSVVQGPAESPLESRPITVENGEITLA
ncbi:MAG TPA: Rieske (2Fe-2S) protein [Pseudonocardia sp.]|nr:Rieske (2Fe-2S) protein [Pseudonocardia sp.]